MQHTQENNSTDKRSAFGNRFLTDHSDVFEHNAWDDVKWDCEQETIAREKVEQNAAVLLDSDSAHALESQAAEHWDKFYCQHEANFFKDRHWLFTEFPELLLPVNVENGAENNDVVNRPFRILEVGCGVGNTIFPLLEANNSGRVFVYGCDFSEKALALCRQHEQFDTNRCEVFAYDLSNSDAPLPFPENSIDAIVMIFVLSAIEPGRIGGCVKRLTPYLKPNGLMLFRDYGRYDMTQLRFKPGRCLSENFYVRGDGTRVYFFTEEDVHTLFTEAGLVKAQLHADRRLQVNRFKQLKMYRVWIQAKYRKPDVSSC